MKTYKLKICLILIIIFLLFGCSDQTVETSFVASVLEVNQTSLLVEPAEGSVELGSADRYVAHLGDAVIVDQEGNEVNITAVEAICDVVNFFK